MSSFALRSLACAAVVLQALPLIVDASPYIPVRRHTSSTSLLRGRDLTKRNELLRPKSDVDLHYLPSDGSNSMLITVTASHTRAKYVMVEDIASLLYNVACSDRTDTLSLDFRHEETYNAAKDLWARDEHLLFITQHQSCNEHDERGVHRATEMTFDDALLRMTANSERLVLGDSALASSELLIKGSEPTYGELRRLSRRDADSDANTTSNTIDLNIPFTRGRDHLISLDNLDLFCNDCSVSGQAKPFFTYRIDTKVMDCVDQIQKDASKRGDDWEDKVGNWIHEGIDGLKCVGEVAEVVGEGFESTVRDLLKGKDEAKLPVVSWIIPEAVVGIQASEDIAAKLDLEINSTTGVDIKCSYPGTCGYTFVSALLGHKATPGIGFSIGSWSFDFSFGYGITLEAKATADVDVKLPVTAQLSRGESAQLDLVDLDRASNTLSPTIDFDTPSFSASDPRVTLSVALGPSIALSLSSSKVPRLSNIGASARLDLPRVQATFKEAHDVDSQCNAGNIKDSVEVDVVLDAGLNVQAGFFIDHSENLTPKLYVERPLGRHCFGSSQDGGHTVLDPSTGGYPNITIPSGPQPYIGNPNGCGYNTTCPTPPYQINSTGISLPTPHYPRPTGTSPAIPTNTGAIQGNYTGPYDCSAVAPSPGGQPCAYIGGGPVTCLSLYSWSCPNGDSGPVPADTICACGAFRHPGWQPPTKAMPTCTSGIYCYDEQTFGVCSPAGIEPPQPVAPGTVCVGGAITYPY